jgi:hypothetical protein
MELREAGAATAAAPTVIAKDPRTNSLSYKAPSWYEKIAAQNRWVARARAYDEWRDQDQLERLQSTRVRFLVETANIGRQLRTKAAEALAHLRAVAYEQVLGPDGEPTTVATSVLSPAAITQLIRAGSELEREALGLGGGKGQGGVSIQIATGISLGAGPSGHLPIPVSDDELLGKVIEVAVARKLTASASVSPGEEVARRAKAK